MIPFHMARSLVGGGLLHAEAFARTDLSCKMHLPASPQCENDRRARPAQNQNAFSQCHVLFASFCIIAVVIPGILPGVAALRDSVARHGMSGFQKAMLIPFDIARRLFRGGLLHAASAWTGSRFVQMHLSNKTHLLHPSSVRTIDAPDILRTRTRSFNAMCSLSASFCIIAVVIRCVLPGVAALQPAAE